MSSLRDDGKLTDLQQLLHAPLNTLTTQRIDTLAFNPKLVAVALWRLGCDALSEREAEQALSYFRQAEQAAPNGKIYDLSHTLALAALGRFEDVDARLAAAYGLWYGDTRFAAAEAMIGLARDDLWASENVLREPAQAFPKHLDAEPLIDLWTGSPSTQLLQSLQENYPDDWQRHLKHRLITEQYYFVLLWREAYSEALEFAQRTGARLVENGQTAGVWHEFQGNAAFLMGDYGLAQQHYENALSKNKNDRRKLSSVYLKLSDLYFLMGDPENERHYRERVYGSLGEK